MISLFHICRMNLAIDSIVYSGPKIELLPIAASSFVIASSKFSITACKIALGHETEWPPRSLDRTLCDFFLWSYIKNKVFTTPPRNLNDLKNRTITEFNELKQHWQIISKSVKTIRRAELCVERDMESCSIKKTLFTLSIIIYINLMTWVIGCDRRC